MPGPAWSAGRFERIDLLGRVRASWLECIVNDGGAIERMGNSQANSIVEFGLGIGFILLSSTEIVVDMLLTSTNG
jgi:hypothetical protein